MRLSSKLFWTAAVLLAFSLMLADRGVIPHVAFITLGQAIGCCLVCGVIIRFGIERKL